MQVCVLLARNSTSQDIQTHTHTHTELRERERHMGAWLKQQQRERHWEHVIKTMSYLKCLLLLLISHTPPTPCFHSLFLALSLTVFPIASCGSIESQSK